MTMNDREELNRDVERLVLVLLDAGEKKLAEKLKGAISSPQHEILSTLTIIEREPGLRTDIFRAVALMKKVIGGDETKRDEMEVACYKIIGFM
jgi:hypothetical protein